MRSPSSAISPFTLHDALPIFGHAFGEQRPQLGRSDEIARGAELGRARAVVAQPRRVKRQLHEAPERDRPDVGRGDLAAEDRKSTRLNSSHVNLSYSDFCLTPT